MSLMEAGSYFDTVSEVGESWDRVKMIPSWDEMLGVELYEKMYDVAPNEWTMFPYTKKDIENKDPKFIQFAKKFVRMLDMAVDMLGPDMEVVEEQLYDLGTSHKRYGVTSKHFELMGQALIIALKKILGHRSFTEHTEKSWTEIYGLMSETMIRGATGI